MARSLKTLREELEEDMHRSTDSTVFDRHVERAVHYYSGKRFWFTEHNGTSFNTASGTEYYAIPSPLRVIDSVQVAIANNDPYWLFRRTNQFIEMAYTPSGVYTGKPRDWAIFDDQIRMYPIPDGTYAVKTQGYGYALPDASAATWESDTATPWSNEAYDLIKARARLTLERDFLKFTPDKWQASQIAEREEFMRLTSENTKRSSSRRLRGWSV